MKIGAATYSFMWDETPESIVEIMHKYGFKGIELCISQPMFHLDQFRPGMYKELKKRLDDYGMHVLNTLIPSMDLNIASTMPEMRSMTVGLFKRLADISLELGAKMMMTYAGKCSLLLPPNYELLYEYCLEGNKAILDYTRYTDLIIGIETLPGKFMGTVDQMKKLMVDLNDSRAGIVYDAANVFCLEDPAEKLKDVKDYIKLLHLSDTKRSDWTHSVLGKGEVDYKAFVQAAVEIGYDGYLVLEIINDGGFDGIMESVERLESIGIHFER